MAQRVSNKGKRAAATTGVAAADDLETRLAAIAAERDAALAELASVRAQLAELETARSQAVNRIDWIIDSLKTVIESER